MPKARAHMHGTSALLVAGLRLRHERGDTRLEDAIGPDPEHVMHAFGFQLGFDSRCGHPGTVAQKDRRVRKAPTQRRQEVPEFVDHPGRTRISTGPQPRPQQEARAALKPDERMIQVPAVPAMKERQLLRPVSRIIRAVQIKDEIGRMLVGPVGMGTEPVDTGPRETLNRRTTRWHAPAARASAATEGRSSLHRP